MGTSNWQNISFCVDLLRRIRPKKILDVGIGFGRWGMLCREYLDVWEGRVFPTEWEVEIVGIEGYQKNIQPYHSVFYSRVINSEALEFLSKTPERFDLIILGDVLEHFSKEQGQKVLELCLLKSQFVLVIVPLGNNWQQGSSYGNAYERHQSVWTAKELRTYSCVVKKKFRDYLLRPYGVFVLSTTKRTLPTRNSFDQFKALLVAHFPLLKTLLKRILSRR